MASDQPVDEATSRLCVKNIPKYVDETRLKEFFSNRGEVTDVKLLRTKDGQSRQMGFIGFKSVEQAQTAQKYYDKSYLDTFRLSVEFARKVGDQQIPRPWSKHSLGSAANANAKKKEGAEHPADGAEADQGGHGAGGAKGSKGAKAARDSPDPEEDADPRLREFMALMQPRSKARIWANDDLLPSGAAAGPAAAAGGGQAKRGKAPEVVVAEQGGAASRRGGGAAGGGGKGAADPASDSDDDEYQDFTQAVRQAHAAGGDSDDEEGRMGGDSDDDDGEGGAAAGTGAKDEVVVNEAISDLDYLRSRMKRWDDDDDDNGGDHDDPMEKDDGQQQQQQQQRQRQRNGGSAKHGGDSDEDGAADDDLMDGWARGDQSGVGASPRCGAAAGEGAPGAKKAKAGAKRGAAAAAARSRSATPEPGAVDPKPKHKPKHAGGEDGGDADVDMAANNDLGDEPAGQQHQQFPPPPPRPRAGDGDVNAGQGGGGEEEREEDEGISETGRLFIRNLAYTASEAELSELFGAHGDLQEVHLVLDRETKRSKGIAYVQFQLPEDAIKAAAQLDGTIFQGRLLHILPAKRQPGGDRAAGPGVVSGQGDKDAGFKAQREVQRKADAGNRAAWNTLFIRSDTVAEAIAAHYGLSKAALLDPTTASGGGGSGGDSVAVRMALGEAHVIATTKQALADAGVNVEALEAAAAASGKAAATKAVSRSPSALLVKNLPYSAQEDELAELFGRPGPVVRLVLPPTRVFALVEYAEPQDARTAFKSLAYKKYQHVPLYLEWAPANVFTAPAQPKQQQQQPQGGDQQQQQGQAKAAKRTAAGAGAAEPAAASAAADGGNADAEVDDADGDDAGGAAAAAVGTIYIKNLAFRTVDAGLRKLFDRAVSAAGGRLHSAVVARKAGAAAAAAAAKAKAKNNQSGDNGTSLGYGFVEVDSEAVAAAVIKQLQGSMLDGHKLVLQLSKRRPSGAAGGGKDRDGAAAAGGSKKPGKKEEGSTKVVVRNVAFEATKKDIQGLFNPFGHLKSCRLPKKFDGSHRGFAFVEFVTKQEARNAMDGVGGTHLYGRRLVVEYAKEEEGLDEIRQRTATKYARDEEVTPAAKKIRL